MGKDKKTWKKIKKQSQQKKFDSVITAMFSFIGVFHLTNEQAHLLLNDILLFFEIEGIYTREEFYTFLMELDF